MLLLSSSGTREQLFSRYHTATRRPDPRSCSDRKVIFGTFRRVVGPWLPANKQAKILDVACGEGWLLLFLREAGYAALSAFDISAENVNICRKLGFDFVQEFDATRIREFEVGKSYDLILALDILEHIPKQFAVQFVSDLRTRLAPGGILLVQTPNMGCVFGLLHRYSDLSHEFCLTESSAKTLMFLGGFAPHEIEIRPAWNAATIPGRFRELYLRLLHRLIFLAEDSSRPQIPTKNLLIVARQ